jgi:hypothetical protein
VEAEIRVRKPRLDESPINLSPGVISARVWTRTKKKGELKMEKRIFAGSVLVLLSLIAIAPVFAQVAPIVYSYGNNTEEGFVRSFNPMKLMGDEYGIFQAGSPKGAVVMNDFANNVSHETSAGFVVLLSWTTLSQLESITISPSDLELTGTARFALNLWIDSNPSNNNGANGYFFTWNGDTFTDLGGDVYALGPGVGAGNGGSLYVDTNTNFYVIGGSLNGNMVTLNTLKNNYPGSIVGIWIGLDIPAQTTGTGRVVIPSVSHAQKIQIVTAP